MIDRAADGLLWLIRTEPELLPLVEEAPVTVGDALARARVGHFCLRCGAVADRVLICDTLLGQRWLDLCHADYHWLLDNVTAHEWTYRR